MQPECNYRSYILTVLVLGAIVLGAVAIRTAWVDPYWVWRSEPGWLVKHHGHNRIIDHRMRHAKSLQVITRRPAAVILGSSRVYRGFDTNTGPGAGIYNMGISSLRIAEAEKFVRHLVTFSPAKRLILGLEYFMFDADQTIVSGFDMDTGSGKYLLTAVPASLFTSQAWLDSDIVEEGLEPGDGLWRRSGFKTTADRDAAGLETISRSFKKHRITDRQYEQLARLMDLAIASELEFQVFLSPMSDTYIASLKKLGEYENFLAWRQRVALLAEQRQVSFHDFSTETKYSQEPIVDRSTDSWIDASHYKPVVGEWILQQLQ